MNLRTDAFGQATPEVTPSPPNANPATYIASNSFTANWSRVSGATGYRLDVSLNSSFSTYVTGYQNLIVGNVASRSVTGLNVSTTYYYRVRAYNEAGTSGNSNNVNVTTLTVMGDPVVTTNPASLVASFSATLNGSVDPHGFPTTVYFQYGTTNAYGHNTPNQTKTGNMFQNVAANIPNLTANTIYHFQMVASNEARGPVYGVDRTFRTLSETGPPVAVTNPATLIASFSATLNGSVDPHAQSTTVYFQYGTTNAYGQTTPNQTKTGNTFQNVAANIPNLTANTTYHFRMVARNNAGGPLYGVDRTFRTLNATGPPVVITNPATNRTTSSARLNGLVNPHGSNTTIYFQYGTTNAYGLNTASQSKSGNTFQNVATDINALAASATYHFRIVGIHSGGPPSNGLDRTFTTLAATATPRPTPVGATPTSTPTATATPTPTPFGGTPTPTPTATPTSTATPTPTPFDITPTPPPVYIIDQIGDSIVQGTTDSGNHGDDVVTAIALPFSYALYDQTFNAINLSSNGNAQLTTTDADFSNVCLPWTNHNYTIFPYWDDLHTDQLSGCSAFPGGTCGIYTSVSGSAPNRIFNIEWRTVYFANAAQQANFELRLYEGQRRFDVIYGTVAQGNSSATAGVQNDNSNFFTQYFCNGSGGAASGGQSYTLSFLDVDQPKSSEQLTYPYAHPQTSPSRSEK